MPAVRMIGATQAKLHLKRMTLLFVRQPFMEAFPDISGMKERKKIGGVEPFYALARIVPPGFIGIRNAAIRVSYPDEDGGILGCQTKVVRPTRCFTRQVRRQFVKASTDSLLECGFCRIL